MTLAGHFALPLISAILAGGAWHCRRPKMNDERYRRRRPFESMAIFEAVATASAHVLLDMAEVNHPSRRIVALPPPASCRFHAACLMCMPKYDCRGRPMPHWATILSPRLRVDDTGFVDDCGHAAHDAGASSYFDECVSASAMLAGGSYQLVARFSANATTGIAAAAD